MDYSFAISSFAYQGQSVILSVCDTLHMKPGMTVSIGGVDTILEDVEMNESITISNDPPYDEEATTGTVPALFFFSGKLKDTAEERAGEQQLREQKVPFFWSREPFSYIGNAIEGDAIGKTVDLVFYILDEALLVGEGDPRDRSTWLTAQHHAKVIEPLENLLEGRLIPYFVNKNNIFDFEDEYSVREHSILSVDDNSNISVLFNEKLSGVEVRITLPILKEGCRC